MGTKRTSWTIYDTLSNINMSDHKLQPGGKISRDPSPRPAKTVQSDRERESKQVEDRRRYRETERMRDKERHKDLDSWNKYCERDRATQPRPPREDERGWREMEKRQENDRGKNGRPLSNMEMPNERQLERGMKKGDTFPRITNISADGARRMMPTIGMDEDRSERRQRERERRREADDRDRERDRLWQRERQGGGERYQEREKEDFRSRGKEVRLVEDEKLRQRDKYQECEGGLQDKRERYATSKRDREREVRVSSPHRRRDRDMYSDRKEKEKAQRREGRRDIRSEGDSDERELRRERMEEREREELTYQHSRSEGDNKGKTAQERDQERQRYREIQHDRQKYRDRGGDRSKWEEGKRRGVDRDRDRERYRDHDRRTAREGEHMKQGLRDFKDDRRDDRHREREHEQRGGRERKGREADPRWDEMTDRSSRSLNQTDPRVPPRTQSSGEWSSDMDSETRRSRDSYEERESGRDSTTESERDKWSPERTAERRRREQHRSERSGKDSGEMAGSVPEQRRMWLDPQRGKNSKVSLLEEESEERDAYRRQKEGQRQGERSEESQAEFLRERRQVKEEADERYFDQSSHRGRQNEHGRKEYRELKVEETEGVSVDREAWRETDRQGKGHLSDSDGGIGGSWQRDTEGENVTDNTEDSDREEEGGSDYAHSESEGGSERGWRQERMLSGEDGFVTVSSGGDEEDEREEEEEFKDCVEFWEGEIVYDAASQFSFREYEGDEKREEEWTMGKEETVDDEDGNAEGEERDKKPKYVFCVIGQTLPRSKPGDKSQSHVDQIGVAEKDESNLESLHYVSDDVTLQPQYDLKQTRNDEHTINNQDIEAEKNLPQEEEEWPSEVDRVSSEVHDTHDVAMRGKVEHHHPEMGTLKRDSKTERLLVEWREKNPECSEEKRENLSPMPRNPYGDVCTQVSYEQIQPTLEAMSPEEVEAIRIRMSGTWSISEETKRHSQAPHLKWAKNVISEILGHSLEEQTDAEEQQNQGVNQSEDVIKDDKQVEETAQRHEKIPVVKVKLDGHSDPELQEEEEEEEEPLEVDGLRGMGQSPADMHADQWTAMHDDTPTYTHADTLLDAERKEDHKAVMDEVTDPSGQLQLDKPNRDEKFSEEDEVEEIEKEMSSQKELEMYLSVSNTLYKPNSCPVLNYELESDIPKPSTEGEGPDLQENIVKNEAEMQVKEPEEKGTVEKDDDEEAGEVNEMDTRKGEEVVEKSVGGGTLTSSCSFRDLGPEARLRRRGIRKTTERRKEELVEVEEEEVEEKEGVGRDRRTRIFSTSDEEDGRSKSWSEVDLRNVLDTIGRRKRNSKLFNTSPLYQQYSEAAQNFEILRQARSDVISICEDASASPAPSPPPACRPLPPLPPVPHPHSLSHTGSLTSARSLPLPEPPRSERRSSSPRLSSSIGQSATLWRDLPAVRNSTKMEELTEDQRRLQEVRFEVVTSEASYCRSLDIVIEHFVKSKQLGALLTTQDRNWLFSRLADVRAISHSFLSKLEEQVESDFLHFTVCDVIARHCQRFKMVYVPYLTNQSYQDATYQRLMNENQGFKRTVEKLERSPVCQRLPLRSFLVLPFQRITRIKLLVQNIVKRTSPGTAEATQAIKALKLLEKLIQESNDSITQMRSIESLVSLSAKVDFECRTLPLISQSRRMVREGQVTELMDFSLKETERNIYMHLFNDYLLLSLQKEGGRFTVIDHAPVSDLRAENCRVKLHSLQKNLFRLHMSNKALLLRTDTQSDKLRWISALSRPHAEIDFSAAQDFPQMQCIRAFVAQQPDEQSLEKADVILVHQQSSDHWVEGTRLSDRQRGWIPESHLETITNSRVLQRNLSDALKLTTATAAV